MSSAVVARRAGRREWIGLVAIALPCALYAMNLTVLNLAVPRLSADLAAGPPGVGRAATLARGVRRH